jgi:hypothetical protein
LRPIYGVLLLRGELFLRSCVSRQSNNDMLYVFMQHLGAFSNRVIRQHMVQWEITFATTFSAGRSQLCVCEGTNDPVTVSLYVRCFHYYLGTTTTSLSHTSQPAVAESQVRIHAVGESILGSLAKVFSAGPRTKNPFEDAALSSGMKQPAQGHLKTRRYI